MTHLRKITIENSSVVITQRLPPVPTCMPLRISHAISTVRRTNSARRNPRIYGPMFRVRKLADNTVGQRVAALRFFFTKTLKRS